MIFTCRCWFESANHQPQSAIIGCQDQKAGFMHQNRKCFTQKGLQAPETWVRPTKKKESISVITGFWNRLHLFQNSLQASACGKHQPDSLCLCDSEVKEGWACRLHAGVPGGGRPFFPLHGAPTLWQEVHQQGRGVEAEQHLPGAFLGCQVTQSREEIPGGKEKVSKMSRYSVMCNRFIALRLLLACDQGNLYVTSILSLFCLVNLSVFILLLRRDHFCHQTMNHSSHKTGVWHYTCPMPNCSTLSRSHQ